MIRLFYIFIFPALLLFSQAIFAASYVSSTVYSCTYRNDLPVCSPNANQPSNSVLAVNQSGIYFSSSPGSAYLAVIKGFCSNSYQNEVFVSGELIINSNGSISLNSITCNYEPAAVCEFPNQINPVTGQCDYCPSGDFDPSGLCLDCPGGDCDGSSSSASSSEPICVWGVDPETGDCLPEPSSSSSGNSSAGSSSGGNGGDGGSGSSSPDNPVPADSTCPNKFQIGDQWYCIADSYPSSSSNPTSSSAASSGGASSSGDGGSGSSSGSGGGSDGGSGSSSGSGGGGGGGGSGSDGEGESSEGANAAVAGSCSATPVCDGDPVGCAILLNAHYERCNTDKTTEGGGDCSAEPACTGDPVGCSIALQNWKLRCDQHGEPVDGDADVAEYDSNFESEFGEDNQASVDDEGALTHLAEVSNPIDFESVDMSGLNINSTGRSSQCPQPRSISLSLGNFEVSYQPLCDLAEGLSTLVVLIFSYISVMLVWRSTQQG